VFVGREAELAALTRAIETADAGTPQAVIVRGEAGVGKTRLIEELCRSLAPTEAVAAIGGCIEVGGEALPFAPFSEALRTLARRMPDEIREASTGQEEVLARIVPELAAPSPGAGRDGDMTRLFELTARILERLASRRLVVLVLEDLHWADASTRHLLGYLLRTRRTGRLMIIATYRSDDVHRRHPLLPLLAEVERLRSVQRLEVARLTRVEVTKQLTGILGVSPDPALLNEIFERSDGNAFFVEELARSYAERSGLEDLRELLLFRLEALPPDGRQIVRIAAESISTAGYALLKAAAGLDEQRLIEALRSAMLARVLVPTTDGSGYDFRHSLMREAVSDSLLPGERSLINRRYAEALEADRTLVRAEEVATRLARHWYHAHDIEKALRMSVSASVEAEGRYAYAEQLRFLQTAMELWDRVDGPARENLPPLSHPEAYPPGLPFVDLLATASVAARRSGELDRALHLTGAALDLLPADPLRAAWFWTRRSSLMQDLNRGDGCTELAQAQQLVAGQPPSVVHADLLCQIALWGARHRPGRPESRDAANHAVDYAASVGAEELELHARITRCWLNSETDVDGTSLAELYAVRRRAEQLGAIGLVGRANHNLPSVLEGMGRSAEAVEAGRHGVEVCRTLGLAETEAWGHANTSLSLFTLGRWTESDTALDEAAAVAQSYKARGVIAARRSHILMLRDDPDAAGTELALARRLLAAEDLQPQMLISLAQYTMELAVSQGRRAAARAEFERADAAGLTSGPVRYALPMLCVAAAIEADAPDAGTPGVVAAIRLAAGRLTIVLPVFLALEKLLEAELGRAAGDDDPGRWALAVAAIERLDHHPYALALAHRGLARALLDTQRRRGEAGEHLARAAVIADRLGARLLSGDIEALAQRAGVPVREPRPEGLTSYGLTPRESMVLRLIASGYSNRRIAEELYISQKTAGTHVSHILAKLGASGRTEAAAIAHRLGVLA
jgi:DNA-binding CsgD family transcriptional regulator